MDRDIVLATLILLVCGGLLMAAGLWRPRARFSGCGDRLEAERWRAIWVPILPAAFSGACLIGWALQEPKITDEVVHPLAWVAAAPVALFWMRALARALRGVAGSRHDLPAETHGFVRPQIHVAPRLIEALDVDAVEATYRHETAHARHKDPIRIWLAQVATDLQFPSKGATGRLADWLVALEIARDEEARRSGADGAALAHAIITAARLCPLPCHPVAAITGSTLALKERVGRLLAPLPEDPPRSPFTVAVGWAIALVVVAGVSLGFTMGDVFVRALPVINF